MRSMTTAIGLLSVAIFVSSLGLVWVKYENRASFRHWQRLIDERDRLEVQWGRLQLELSAWGTHARIERIARERLDMRVPSADEVVIIKHER